MEGLTTRLYKGVKGYCRTRGYQRLTKTALHSHGGQEEESGSKPRRRRFWRIRLSPRLTLKLKLKPKKLYVGFRDAYVRIMMKLGNSAVVRGRTVSGHGGQGFGTMTLKEYDEKMIVEIYKALAMRQGQLVKTQIPTQIACSV